MANNHLADDWTRFRRFLCMGREPALYAVEDADPSRRSVTAMKNLIANGEGQAVVQEIKTFCREGRAAKYKPLIYALAICAKDQDVKDAKVKEAAYDALCDVCKIPTHLFLFLYYCHSIIRECHDDKKRPIGWGRCSRSAVSKWYNSKEPMTLALYVTKYKQRHRWSHRDIMRMAHVKGNTPEISLVLQYAVRGFDEMQKKVNELETPLSLEGEKIRKFLTAVQSMKATKDASAAAHLIREYKLVREHVPTWLHNAKEVWEALLEDMPVHALLRNLGKMSAIPGMFPVDPKDDTGKRNEELVVSKLNDRSLLNDSESKVHPMSLLVAMNVYQHGKGDRGKLKWEPNAQIAGALETAFINSFDDMKATDKQYLVFVDVSVSMDFGDTAGMARVPPLAAAAAVVYALRRTEKNRPPIVAAFSPDPQGPMDVTWNMQQPTYREVYTMLKSLDPANMDPARGIEWATKKRKEVDVFLALTDEQTSIVQTTPKQALDEYRSTMNKPHAKLVVVGLSQSAFSLADPSDPGMLDVAGFDGTALQVIQDFANGRF